MASIQLPPTLTAFLLHTPWRLDECNSRRTETKPSTGLRLRELMTMSSSSVVGRQAKYLFTHERAPSIPSCASPPSTRGVLFVVNHKVKPKPKPKPKPLTCCGYAADSGKGEGQKKTGETESDRVIPFGLY